MLGRLTFAVVVAATVAGCALGVPLARNTLNNPAARGSDCVANCRHMSNGDYQSCKTCEGYVTCAYGRLYDRPCPANLLWDDERKRCEWESRTCNIPPTTRPVQPGECIKSCDGIHAGIYQSCKGCNVFAKCNESGVLEDNIPCSAGLTYDDIAKQCVRFSSTCGVQPNNGTCVSTCRNMPNGDYNSCHGCQYFVTCSEQMRNDLRRCPAGLEFDSGVGICLYKSRTCPYLPDEEDIPKIDMDDSQKTTVPTPGYHRCVSDCRHMRTGDYQSCETCEGYVTCAYGRLYDRPCPANLLWDDERKRCEWESRTCNIPPTTHPVQPGECIDSCDGIRVGIYQSCKGCNVFAKCNESGVLEDNIACSAGLTYDDIAKQCVRFSSTCGVQPNNGTCVSTCLNMPNGDYNSCHGCQYFVTCSEQMRNDLRRCPTGLEFDSGAGICLYKSRTCPYRPDEEDIIPKIPNIDDSQRTTVPAPGHHRCVSDCRHMPNGDYQSCETCEGYVTCAYGRLYDRPCPANLLWDDERERCLWESRTCNIPPTTRPVQPGECIESCDGIRAGIYQSCKGCSVFAKCDVSGVLEDNISCPVDLTYDDIAKQCVRFSSTCDVLSNNGTCVSTCLNMPNGDYNSCHGCQYFVTCSEQIRNDLRRCAAGLEFDSGVGICVYKSRTCPYRLGEEDIVPEIPDVDASHKTTEPAPGHSKCVSDCRHMSNGDYQSCKTCAGYVTCVHGLLYERPCPADLVWDDVQGRCEWTSSTCGVSEKPEVKSQANMQPALGDCITSCAGLANGIYQSCQGCEVYAKCDNEILEDNIPCSSGNVYDDTIKTCVRFSSTCGVQPNNGTCVSSCVDMANGNYQSCRGCDRYVACSGHIRHDDIYCPQGLFWDDNVKSCVFVSTTCPAPEPETPENPATTAEVPKDKVTTPDLEVTESPKVTTPYDLDITKSPKV